MRYYSKIYEFPNDYINDFWKKENFLKNRQLIVEKTKTYRTIFKEYIKGKNKNIKDSDISNKMNDIIKNIKYDSKGKIRDINDNVLINYINGIFSNFEGILDKDKDGKITKINFLKNGDLDIKFSDIITFRDQITAMALAKKLGFLTEKSCENEKIEEAIGAVVAVVLGSSKFTKWLDNIIYFEKNREDFKTNTFFQIIIEDIDLFGAPCKYNENDVSNIFNCRYKKDDLIGNGIPNIGFIKMNVKTYPFSPGITVLRGDAVGFLIYYKKSGKIKTIITFQDRIPAGVKCYEIPAGMMDGTDDYLNGIIKEMKEEIGIKLTKEELINNKIDIEYGNNSLFYTSQGLLDEKLKLCIIEITDKDKIEAIETVARTGVKLGNINEGEELTLKIIPLDDLPKYCNDLKSLVCWNYIRSY